MKYIEMMSNQEMKSEAVKIMRRMGIAEDIIKDYELNDSIPKFEFGKRMQGRLFSSIEGVMEYYDIPYKPYAITTDRVYGYKMFNFLYLSPYREDLEHMCRQLNDGMFAVYAYCYNVDRPELSESGSILIKITNGNIQRVG